MLRWVEVILFNDDMRGIFETGLVVSDSLMTPHPLRSAWMMQQRLPLEQHLQHILTHTIYDFFIDRSVIWCLAASNTVVVVYLNWETGSTSSPRLPSTNPDSSKHGTSRLPYHLSQLLTNPPLSVRRPVHLLILPDQWLVLQIETVPLIRLRCRPNGYQPPTLPLRRVTRHLETLPPPPIYQPYLSLRK